jgi:zinc D-Ala-D-Ala dipeptidase
MKFLICLTISIIIGITLFSQIRKNKIILIADPRILSIPIMDNHEAMVDLTEQNEIMYGPSPEVPNNHDYTKMRKTVYEKLVKAQRLLPTGIRFCLYEAYRSLELQKKLFDTRLLKLKQQHPEWSYEQLFLETTKLVSPVINLDESVNIPPHSTGGAIDIYLVNAKGEALDMGIHPRDWIEDSEDPLSASTSSHISAQAQKNRKIMSKALSALGFVNYPTEYWHWSYGDRYWAYFKKRPYAIYSSYQEAPSSNL